MKVLVCCDYSPAGKHILQEAKKFVAPYAGSEVHIYNVLDMAVVSASGMYSNAEVMSSLEAQSKELSEMAKEVFDGKAILFSNEVGYPAERIVHKAHTIKADLIILGTHGKTGLNRVLLGSVAENVLRHATCNTLIIPVKQF
jgi:nucleotide-binding universal stress UspA family protein